MKITYLIHRLDDSDKKYGVPELKKFPMPDADHVRSAIKFFNYIDSKYEKELAKAILERMKEYGLTFDDIKVGEENRFIKYVPEKYLAHHGILGMKWGVRRFQNEDGSLTYAGKKRYGTKADRLIDDINKGNLSYKARGYNPMSLKGARSKAYLEKQARKDKALHKSYKDLQKHPYSKKNKEEYIKQAKRFVNDILGDRVNETLKIYNRTAGEHLLIDYFSINYKDL